MVSLIASITFWYIMEYHCTMLGLNRVRTGAGGTNSFCPLCNAWRMARTAVHLAHQGFSLLLVQSWVLCVRRSLRYFLECEPRP